jgi:hypothetical protein
VLNADDYRGSATEGPLVSVCYEITADAHSDVLLRVTVVLNFANQAPWSFSLRTPNPEEVFIDGVLRDVPGVLAELIRRKLMQLTCLIGVDMRAWP